MSLSDLVLLTRVGCVENMLIFFSGRAVRVDVPNEGVDDEAVVLAGGAEEGPGEDVALGVAELVGGGGDGKGS